MWPGFPWTDREVHVLGRRERTEKAFHHLWSSDSWAGAPQTSASAQGCRKGGGVPQWGEHGTSRRGPGPPPRARRWIPQAALCCQHPPCRATAAPTCAAPKEGRNSGIGVLGVPRGSAQRELPQCYPAGFDQTQHLWGLCLVLPGDPQ